MPQSTRTPQNFARSSREAARRALIAAPRAVRHERWTAGPALVAGLATAAIVYATLRSNLGTDFEAHVGMTAEAVRTGIFPGNFLFYLLDASFAGFTTNFWALKLGLVFIIGVATSAKAWLSIRFVLAESGWQLAGSDRPRWALPLAAAAGILLSLTFSLPSRTAYLGQIPSNVWHNSTTMTLMPFAVALFWSSLAYLREPTRRWLWISLGLAALNVATKPSFVLCFIPIFPLAALIRFRLTRPAFEAIALTGACGVLVVLQYIYIYVADPTSKGNAASNGVALDPFNVWNAYSTNLLESAFLSYLFPLAALLLGGRAIRSSVSVRYALALALVGLAEFSLLTETGPRELDGNFLWQAIVTSYILFLALAGALAPWFLRRGDVARKLVIAAAFLAHVWAAYHFLDHFFTTRSLA